MSYKKEFKVAKQASEAGAEIIRKYTKESSFEVTLKGKNDLVTDADLASEKEIIARIRDSFPDDEILAEEKVIKILKDMGHDIVDYGTHSEESVDYPDFAVQVAEKVNDGEYELGIVICGSGQGVCMTANKYPKVRAGLVYSTNSAKMTRLHNNANVLCLPGRELNEDQMKELVNIWLNTEFEGGRHKRRIDKIESLTK